MSRSTAMTLGLLGMLALALLVGPMACSTGRADVRNSFGTIVATFPQSPQVVTAAATEALKDMDLILLSSEATGVDGRVTARTANQDHVKIDVAATDDGGSEARVRIGAFGNESMSLTILDAIRKRLE